MVQFGKRFETSQTRRWLRHNADYERLKLLLNLAGAAREREPAEKTTGLNNFGDRDNAGLLESDVVLAPGVFDSGLEALEKIKYLDKSEYVLRPDFINSLRMLIN